jgi:DNA primase
MPEFGDYPPMELHGQTHGGSFEPHFPPAQTYSPSPAYSPAPAASSGKPGKFSRKPQAGNAAPRRPAGRILPASREDRVLRLLLTEPQHWDQLSNEEHHVLLELPAPHGPLFAWLESQLHEHGPQPWAALREALRGHAHEHHALTQLAQMLDGVESDWDEIRGILNQLLNLKLESELSDLAARAATDPAAFQRYRELSEQLRARKAAEKSPKNG